MWRSDEVLPSMPKGGNLGQLALSSRNMYVSIDVNSHARRVEISLLLFIARVLALMSTRLAWMFVASEVLELMSTRIVVMEIGLTLMCVVCQAQGDSHGCCSIL